MEAGNPSRLSVIEKLVRSFRAPTRTIHQAPALCRPEQNSELLKLPGELLAKIFNDSSYELNELCNIRLVCCLLNETIQHQVLRDIKLPGKPDKVKAMARGGNGFCEAAEILHLSEMSTDRGPSGDPSPFYNAVKHKAQSKYLCSAISTLKSIESVRWHVCSPLKLNKNIMSALQQLPSLRHMKLVFASYRAPYEQEQLLLGSGFTHLKSVSLVNVYSPTLNQGHIDVTTSDIRYILTSCSTLETFHIVAFDRGRSDIDFLSMIEDIPSQTNFSPSLTALKLHGISFSFKPAGLQYLAKLKSLDIHNVEPSDEKIWDAMTSYRLKIEVVKVAVVTSALVGYLLSFQGLQEIHVDQDGLRPRLAPPPDEEAKRKLLYSVLPHHQATLIAVHFRLLMPRGFPSQQRKLEMSREELTYMKALPGMKTVGITYGYPADDGSPRPWFF